MRLRNVDRSIELMVSNKMLAYFEGLRARFLITPPLLSLLMTSLGITKFETGFASTIASVHVLTRQELIKVLGSLSKILACVPIKTRY